MERRVYLFYGMLILGMLLLMGRLFELQIIYGAKNREVADGNRIRKIVNPAPRGMILDRSGRELVRNIPLYRIKKNGSEQEPEWQTISRDEALRIEARGGKDLENFRVDIGRSYVYGPPLAHILGYLGELNSQEVTTGKGSPGDLVGRTGIEEEYNYLLKGIDGGEVYEVNASEERIRDMGKSQPIPGKNIRLTIDAELSRTAFQALDGKTGAVVVTDAQNGQVLALVSSPSFDPQNLTSEVLNDNSMPMFNRALSGLYPPGSTFKIVTATAGLEEGKIDGNTIYEDKGFIQVGSFTYNNWYYTQYGKTEGPINLVKAFKRSTDTFFYKVGEWVGPEKIAFWAEQFGLGERTGIDIPGEVAGLVPNPEWKEETIGERWFLGNTYHFAIGQADLLTTPLQINMMTGVIASGGKLCRPRIANLDTKENIISNPSGCRDLQIKSEYLELITEGMRETCSTGGTAFPFFNFEIAGSPAKNLQHGPSTNSSEKASAKSGRVACKTGTAEFGPLINGKRKTHAWLTAFAPFDSAQGNPAIVVTVLVEGGGEGSYVAAPIAKKVIEKWFKL